MSVNLTRDGTRVAMWDTVTGFAFGPTFLTVEDADSFLAFARSRGVPDLRYLPYDRLTRLHDEWTWDERKARIDAELRIDGLLDAREEDELELRAAWGDR